MKKSLVLVLIALCSVVTLHGDLTLSKQSDLNFQLFGNYSHSFDEKRMPQGFKEQLDLIHMAAEQGNANAQYNLALIYYKGSGVLTNFERAICWYQKAAEQGVIIAQRNLGLIYYVNKGVHQDYKKAIYWFAKASEQGDGQAQAILGSMCGLGHGIPQNFLMAYIWSYLAALQGNEVGKKTKIF